MLNQKEKAQIRAVLAEELRRLAKKAESALSYSMNHERNIGRDSIRWNRPSCSRYDWPFARRMPIARLPTAPSPADVRPDTPP